MTLFRRALLYAHTLRYLRPIQIFGRIRFRLSRPDPDTRPAPPFTPTAVGWKRPAARPISLLGPGRFHFLGETGDLSTIGWDGPERSRLWRYNQHYFDDLTAAEASSRAEWHSDLVRAWLIANPPGSGTGWEPYPTSLRLVNWSKWTLAGNEFDAAAVASLAVQARWLTCRLEWHLLGNHLFSNGKALVFAGCLFEGSEAERWLRRGLEIVESQLEEQILPDGGHFELSPMYHALAVEDQLDLVNLLEARGIAATDLCARLRVSVEKMLVWLDAMTHPDGEISFFNDAAFGIAPEPLALFAYAERLGVPCPPPRSRCTDLSSSGFARIDEGPAALVVDAAPIGPDHLPGHAHADTLSFELSLFGRRAIVNCGTSVYGTSEERQRQRGTAAHSTVLVDGEDSSEVWSGFRVARRARILYRRIGEERGSTWLEAAHDGYCRGREGALHRRRWTLCRDRLVIRDSVPNARVAEARFHLHPDVAVDLRGERGSLRVGDHEIDLVTSGGPPRLERSNWHPRFGESEPTRCLVLPLRDGSAAFTLLWNHEA